MYCICTLVYTIETAAAQIEVHMNAISRSNSRTGSLLCRGSELVHYSSGGSELVHYSSGGSELVHYSSGGSELVHYSSGGSELVRCSVRAG